jgi:hypothetical protein
LRCDVGVEPEFLVGVEGFIFVEVRVHFGDELGYVGACGRTVEPSAQARAHGSKGLPG